MNSKFKKINPDDPAYAKLSSDLSQINADRFDYDGLAREYVETAPKGIIQFPYTEGKASVVSRQLEKRGLARGLDFTIQSAKDGETNYVFVTRLTEKAPQAVQSKPRGRKPAEGKGDAAAPGEAASA